MAALQTSRTAVSTTSTSAQRCAPRPAALHRYPRRLPPRASTRRGSKRRSEFVPVPAELESESEASAAESGSEVFEGDQRGPHEEWI